MRQLSDISDARDRASTLLELTSAFEGIASMRIAQIKDQVLRSSQFFDELWRIYSQLNRGSFNFGRHYQKAANDKRLLIFITSQGGFGSDIDRRLINEALRGYNSKKDEIIVVGLHGLAQLRQAGIRPALSFKLPASDRNFNVRPLVSAVQKYSSTVVYYPSYVSLQQQVVKTIVLGEAINQRGQQVTAGEDVISESTYIFEPSAKSVVEHLETAMTGIALSEVVLESKLAQYASRYRSNSLASEKARDSLADLNWQFNRARRQTKDERLKEILNGLRTKEQL